MTYIRTVSGIKLSLIEPRTTQVNLLDIATGLANNSRWVGQTKRRLSVSEHSIIVSRRCPTELKLAGLFHDAAEAYLGDLATPVKQMFPDYKQLELKILEVIFRRFKIDFSLLPQIKQYDDQVKNIEENVLYGVDHFIKPVFSTEIRYLNSRDAKLAFLDEFNRLAEDPEIIKTYQTK